MDFHNQEVGAKRDLEAKNGFKERKLPAHKVKTRPFPIATLAQKACPRRVPRQPCRFRMGFLVGLLGTVLFLARLNFKKRLDALFSPFTKLLDRAARGRADCERHKER